MSNKRIDLQQFEGITKGKWEIIDLPGGGIDIGVRYTNHGHTPVINFTQRMGEQVRQIERDVADMNAIAAVPDLIAELKRMYEKLDMAESALTEIWAHQIDNAGGYNVTETLLYYEKKYGLNIKPEASD